MFKIANDSKEGEMNNMEQKSQIQMKEKELSQELNQRIKSCLAQNNKQLMIPLIRSFGRMLSIQILLIILIIASPVVFAFSEFFLKITLIFLEFLSYCNIALHILPAIYQYWKECTQLCNKERIKFFLLKWTDSQYEKIEEIAENNKENKPVQEALFELKEWITSEVSDAMRV